MKKLVVALVACLLVTGLWTARSYAGCAINLKIKNDHPVNSGTIVWVWFKTSGSRNKKTGGTFWNPVCGSGDNCVCPTYRSVYPGQEYVCGTRLESSCGSDDRDFDLIYDQGTSESNKTVVGAVKAKRNIEVTEGGTVTFTWQ